MTNWIVSQMTGSLARTSGATVVLDPDGVLDRDAIAVVEEACEVHRVSDWASLRRVWDLNIRRRAQNLHLLVLSTSEEFATAADLPWDIEDEAAEVVRLRWPVPVELQDLLRAANSTSAANIVAAASQSTTLSDIVASAFDVAFGNPGDELECVARLRLQPDTPVELWDVLKGLLSTAAARSVADGRGDIKGLQKIWDDWLSHGSIDGADAFLAAPGAILLLLGTGLLKPAPIRARGLPDWVQIGAANPDPEQLIAELLDAQPSSSSDLGGWTEMASWWGQVRAALAASPTQPVNAEAAWALWEDLDVEFRKWLKSSYGSALLSTVPFGALHRIASELARRVEHGAKILLIVIDGLGFAQWHPLRNAANLDVLDVTGSLAMIPTLTSVSRQAIFAGSLPREFAKSINTTSAEERRWRQFWTEHGVTDGDISYSKVLGDDAGPIPEPHGRVAALVVNAVDEILHGAHVLDDRQVANAVDLWAQTGFLTNVVTAATQSGYETWITSDHGNLPTLPRPVPREGQTVEQAGIRVRIYPNAVLRENAATHGEIWDPPGLPTDYYPLFPPGRSGFHSGASRVGHGGISIDEVIVPVARVSA